MSRSDFYLPILHIWPLGLSSSPDSSLSWNIWYEVGKWYNIIPDHIIQIIRQRQSRSKTSGGPMQNCVDQGGLSGYERMNETHLTVSNRARGKRSRNSVSSAARYAFNSFLLVSSKRLYGIHVTRFDRILHRKGRKHHITINYHSCFNSRWPNSETKLKWNHVWEQGRPLVFRGPTQLAYSAYREDWLWAQNKTISCSAKN